MYVAWERLWEFVAPNGIDVSLRGYSQDLRTFDPDISRGSYSWKRVCVYLQGFVAWPCISADPASQL